MSIIRLIILVQALFTFFIAGGMFFKDNSIRNRSIALFSVLFGFEILYFLFGTSKIGSLYPFFRVRFYFSLGVLYGPLLYFHFKSILNQKLKISAKDLIHFIPLVALNIYMFNLIIMPIDERIIYYTNRDNFYNCVIYLNYFRSAHQIVYGVILLNLFKKHSKAIEINTKFYLGSLSIIYFTSTIVISLLVFFANSWRDFSSYYLLNNIIVFLIAYVLYEDPKFFRDIKKKYKHSNLSNKEIIKLKEELILLFKNELPYLNKQLNIDYLATKLNTKPHYLSQTFTREIKENFNDFVNRYRIEYSKNLLTSLEYKNLKIEAIAEESGFNNKVTFYKAFSKFENTTPSKFRKSNQKV
ncbi:helix-turn-helix domain-containing protein [Tenacibaculum sp. MEBiC06402]|uniref:helix-turn-helix domain-containing protein n=1 Tax=unclassified Tenacibaculum TaxID=2635139 RepID=UPI003B9BE874